MANSSGSYCRFLRCARRTKGTWGNRTPEYQGDVGSPAIRLGLFQSCQYKLIIGDSDDGPAGELAKLKGRATSARELERRLV
jgi:hypothetical protein